MATSQDNTKDSDAKRAALHLLSRGLVTKSEAARMAGVSRQLVGAWAKNIPVDRNREAYVSKVWRDALRRKQ